MKINDQIMAAIDEQAPRFAAAWFPYPTARDVRLVRCAMHMGAVIVMRIRVDEMIEKSLQETKPHEQN